MPRPLPHSIVRRLATTRGTRTLARERETLFQALFESIADAVFLTGPDRRFIMANQVALDRLGYTLEELKRLGPQDINPAGEGAAVGRAFAELEREGTLALRTWHVRKDGTSFPVEVRSRRVELGGRMVIVSSARDITGLLRQEAELRRLNRLYAALSQVKQALVWARNREELLVRTCEVMVVHGGFAFAWIGWNDPATREVRIAGRAGDDRGYLDGLQVRSDDTPLGRGATGTAIRTGHPRVVEDILASSAQGPWHAAAAQAGIASSAALPIRMDGEVVGALSVYAATRGFFGRDEMALLEEAAADVSFGLAHLELDARRRTAEEALRESEFFFKESQRAAAVGSYKADFVAGVWKSSEVLDQIFGIGPDFVRSIPGWLDLIHPEDRQGMQAYLQDHVIRNRGAFDRKYRIVRNCDQAVRWVHGMGEGVFDADGACVGLIGTIHDITAQEEADAERAFLQAQLVQSQKMESLGTLAGGIAHDMNNILGAIYASTQTLRARHPDLPGLGASLDTVERAATRGRDLVKRLVGFTRKSLGNAAVLDVNEMVRQEMALLDHTLLQRFNLVMDLEEPLPPILGEAGTLGSALMNLCINAVDAMPSGGTLTIRTRRAEDGCVEIRVEDTGLGMAPEVLARALEPFFTTKPVDKGTGLGLPIVFNTVKAHGGTLELHSEEGRGTQALLRLPALPEGAAAPRRGVPARGELPPLRILLVDDDELLLDTVPGLLQALGHQVDAAAGGREALEKLGGGAPDLVILDLNMPGMSGLETLREIRARLPEQRVLLATGFLDPEARAVTEADPLVRVITKPFSLEEIGAAIVRIGAAGRGAGPE